LSMRKPIEFEVFRPLGVSRVILRLLS